MIFTQAIERNAQVNGQQLATICGTRKQTWSQLETRVAKFAAALQAIGVKPGERVAALALNSDRYLEFYYAVAWAGAVMVPLNNRWSAKENQYALNDSGAVALLVDDNFLQVGITLKTLCPAIENFIYMGDKETPAQMLGYETLIASHEVIEPFDSHEDDLLGIFYTGGTTGFPKGVMLSHKNIWSSTISALTDLEFCNRDQPMLMVAGPMFHLAAGMTCWCSAIGGVPMTIVSAFNISDVLACIERDKVTDTLLVPTMISMLHSYENLTETDVSSLKQIVYGASPMPEGTLLEAMEKMPSVGFTQAYGQTELSPLGTVLKSKYHVLDGPNAGKIRSAGRAGFCVRLQVFDENNQPLAANQVGEVCVKAPNVMMGYWNNPEQSQAAIVDGWLHTGDAGYLDDDGFLFLVDRVKDMIVSGGENVFSAEVESALSKHDAVHEVSVIGIPSEQWGESVHAIVRLKPDMDCEEQKLIDFTREFIAGYKVPRSVEFRDEAFPITGAGKIQKTELRKPYWQNSERNIN